jgi:hypothetical protein
MNFNGKARDQPASAARVTNPEHGFDQIITEHDDNA